MNDHGLLGGLADNDHAWAARFASGITNALAQFTHANTALRTITLPDASFTVPQDSLVAHLAGAETLASKTLTSPVLNTPTINTPVLSGAATGTYTLGGTPTIPASGLTGAIPSATQDSITRVGTLAAGVVPLARMKVDEQAAENGSLVTLTVGSDVTIISLVAGMNVVQGDRVIVHGAALLTKGGTGGITGLIINKEAGSSTVSAYASANNLDLKSYVEQSAGSSGFAHQVWGIFDVTTSGTLTLRLRGYVTGSNTTVNAGDGNIYALVLRGT